MKLQDSRAGRASCWTGVERDRPLARRTSFRIGGPAALFVEPLDFTELQTRIADAVRLGIPRRILGGGTNLLVADDGIEALVLSTRRLLGVQWGEGGTVTSGAGESLPVLVRACARRGLAGLECLGGIPGTVGGAVAMRSGGGRGDCHEHLVSVTTLHPNGDLHVDSAHTLDERLAEGGVILSASFELATDDPGVVRQRLDELVAHRDATQPLSLPSAGCMFRNPIPECAGRLIDEAGLKGTRIGAAEVSTQHANFIINTGAARASDVIALAEDVRARVLKHSGVPLEREVTLWQ